MTPRDWDLQSFLSVSTDDGQNVSNNESSPATNLTVETSFYLENMPGDFVSMVSLDIEAEVTTMAGGPFGIRIQSAGAGTLASSSSGASTVQTVSTSGQTGIRTVSFDYVNTSAAKSEWDDALVIFRHNATKDTINSVGVDYVEFNGVYSDGASPPSAPTLDTPTDSATIDMGSGYTFEWTHNSNESASQTGYRFRRRVYR